MDWMARCLQKGEMMIKDILIQIFVSDINKAKKWYIDKLGFKMIEEYPKWKCFYAKIGSVTFDIGEPNSSWGRNWIKAKKKIGGLRGIFFETDDINKEYNKLKKSGVRFTTKPTSMPWSEIKADFIDPDKNEYSLIQVI